MPAIKLKLNTKPSTSALKSNLFTTASGTIVDLTTLDPDSPLPSTESDDSVDKRSHHQRYLAARNLLWSNTRDNQSDLSGQATRVPTVKSPRLEQDTSATEAEIGHRHSTAAEIVWVEVCGEEGYWWTC